MLQPSPYPSDRRNNELSHDLGARSHDHDHRHERGGDKAIQNRGPEQRFHRIDMQEIEREADEGLKPVKVVPVSPLNSGMPTLESKRQKTPE